MNSSRSRQSQRTTASPTERGRYLVPTERVQSSIHVIRGQKVMLDFDLAPLYGVTTGNLNKAVRRNLFRFPGDFYFQLNRSELHNLLRQIGRASWGGRRNPAMAFTEQGVAMLSSVLHTRRAALVNVQIMRVFVQMRELMLTHQDLARKLDELEKKHGQHEKHFTVVFDALRQLIGSPASPRRKIGFHTQAKARGAQRRWHMHRLRRPQSRAPQV